MESPVKIVAIFVQLICIIKSQKYISHDGTPSQSTTYVWTSGPLGADLAVTGGPTNDFHSRSCATTAVNQYTAWWMLAFPGNTIYFTNVKIFYRSNTPERLAGYSLYVTNSSVTINSPKPTNGHLCFHHTGTELPSMNQTVDCNVLGQYVVIYNERNRPPSNNTPGYSSIALLELCDVQIYGCYKSWWNSNCSTPCPFYCLGDHCYPGNGSCVWGCNPDNCLNDICDTDSGKCTQGCKIGLRGDYCDKACESGTFGQNCANTCHCINQSCDPITGVCPPGGCEHGFTSSNCSTACDDGYFGMNCAHQCYCRYGACIKATGICPTKGCQRGWKGDTCSEECSDGDHGFDCVEHCNTCHSTLCERFEGNCTYGCIEGFKGYQCLVSATCTPQSDEQSTTDHTLNIIYAVIGTFIANTFVCIIIFLAIFRYRRGKADGDTNRQNTSGYLNNAFTNDYANNGNKNAESHYEETIPSTQEQNYDTI